MAEKRRRRHIAKVEDVAGDPNCRSYCSINEAKSDVGCESEGGDEACELVMHASDGDSSEADSEMRREREEDTKTISGEMDHRQNFTTLYTDGEFRSDGQIEHLAA